jgi:hypothetical protein
MVMMSLAWGQGFDFTPPAASQRIKADSGTRRNVLHDESSRRTHAGDARSKARFPAMLTNRSEPLPLIPTVVIARPFFDRSERRPCGTNSPTSRALPDAVGLKYAVRLQWRFGSGREPRAGPSGAAHRKHW